MLEEDDETVGQLQTRIQDLEQQVHGLERKLADLHCTDVNSLQRAYNSLSQHIQALDVESKHLQPLVERLHLSFLTPDYIAKEVGYAGAAVAAVWSLDRTLRLIKVPSWGVNAVTKAASTLAGTWFIWQLLRSSGMHVQDIRRRNQQAKEQLQEDCKVVRLRIEAMKQLLMPPRAVNS